MAVTKGSPSAGQRKPKARKRKKVRRTPERYGLKPARSVAELVADFWAAPDEAMFDQKIVALVIGHSESWCEVMRWKGGGIPFYKVGNKVLYQKRDVIAHRRGTFGSTSEYAEVVS